MNRKTIKRVLNKKINEWIESITDEDVKRLVKANTIVTGGAIASMLLNEDVKDFDVYFKNKETVLAVSNYYVNKFNEAHKDKKNRLGHVTKAFVLDGEDVCKFKDGLLTIEQIAPGYTNQGGTISHMITNTDKDRVKIIIRSDGVAAENESILEQPFEDVYDVLEEADAISEEHLETKETYRPIFLSSNAITLSNKIQLVIRFHGEPEEIHKNYDFVHCTNYWTSKGNNLILQAGALEAILTKQLVYQGSKYPLCSVIRTRKFIKRGFHINAGQYLKMLFQVSKLDLTDINVLEDQLVGVDSAYFMILIDGLRSRMKNDPNFKIEEDYVASIIDKIF